MVPEPKPPPVAPCPRCQHPAGRWMPSTSASRKADWFCCVTCWHIWHTDALETKPANKEFD